MLDAAMLFEILFWMLLVVACLYSALLGGTSGRVGTALFIAATIATDIANDAKDWLQTNWSIASIDVALLIGLYIFALKSRCYWPLWVTAFQLITVVTHVATIFAPAFRDDIYFGFSGLWSLMTLVAMVVGVAVDRPARQSNLNNDRRPKPDA